MYYLETATVEGFWGNHTVNLNLYKDVNFLIGVNGSGKTTFLNLIASTISGDLAGLLRFDFTRIILNFHSYKGTTKPSIEVIKCDDELNENFSYKIKPKSSGKSIKFDFTYLIDPEDRFVARALFRRTIRQKNYTRNILQDHNSINDERYSLEQELAKIVSMSWLTVHRGGGKIRKSEKAFDSQVDEKLDEVTSRLIQYFGSLSNKSEKKSEEFQQDFLLQILFEKNDDHFVINDENIDVDSEKSSLYDIFDDFNIPKTKYEKKIDRHFKLLKESLDKLSNNDQKADISDYFTVVSARKFEKISEGWKGIRKDKENIFLPRDLFLKTINSMLNRKKIFLDNDNSFLFETQSGKLMGLNKLSSGEKQLFILLAESTLQKNEPFIYFADEPEISLHVKWQNQIVIFLQKTNPNGQIVFATHSPDIVGQYSNNVHDMEKKVQ